MASLLSLIGGLTVTILCIQFSRFIISRYAPSELPRYIRADTYALVTGATDGIGKCIAVELARRGSNVILHGRNQFKLEAVQEEVKKYGRDVVIWRQEASLRPDLTSLKKFPISILVNNAAQAGMVGLFQEFTMENIENVIYSNSTFPTLLTNFLLPNMSKPALVLNMTSQSGVAPTPLMTVYSGSKAYLYLWSRSMHAELGKQRDVVVQAVMLANVKSNSNRLPASVINPTGEYFAERVCDSISRGRVITPYLFHAIVAYIVGFLPNRLVDSMVKGGVQDVARALKDEKVE